MYNCTDSHIIHRAGGRGQGQGAGGRGQGEGAGAGQGGILHTPYLLALTSLHGEVSRMISIKLYES